MDKQIIKNLINNIIEDKDCTFAIAKNLAEIDNEINNESIPIEPPVKPPCETIIKTVQDYLDALRDEERLNVINEIKQDYCMGCGTKNRYCQCDNDD